MADRRSLPRLMGQQEIRERLGYSRQHTANLIGQKGFPDPAYELAMGRIWLAEDVEAWIREHRPELAGEE
ncbi:MAG TPA: DNA-binding protein [Nocardioidaceae bacterium]|nr:DNA-binding protein [Nocardioidaceae bacterium]